MKLRVSIALVVLAAALWLTQSARVRTQSSSASGNTEDYQGRSAASGEVLVRLRPGAATGPLHALIDAVDDQPIGSQGWHRIRSASRLVQELVTTLAGRSDVLAVEPNYVVHTMAVPNDPFFSSMWDLLNTANPGADIHVVPAWDVTTGSTANVIGVVDTGVDYTHPDLVANMWSAPTAFTVTLGSGPSARAITCPAGSHGFNAILWTCDPMDDMYHGTHVSGTIGAVGNNSVGITGVNWTTRIMGLKFLNSSGSGNVSDAVNAVDFALKVKAYFASHGGGANVRVLSNSWGGSGFSSALSDEISSASSANVLFVAAAGNNASNIDVTPTYPASYTQSNVITVAATTSADGLASYSNYGPTSVDLGAPGDAFSTEPGGAYGWLSGTSMATPHVSGAAMLLLSACNLNTTQLKNAILNNVDPLASLTGLTVTGGRLNVDRAVRSCVTVPTVSLTAPANGATYAAPATITLAANASDPDGIGRVEFYQGTSLIGTSTTAPFGGTWANVPAGSYTLTAKAYDIFGAYAVSTPVNVTVAGSGGGASATFLNTDNTTQGSWSGVYGADGAIVVNDSSRLPSYATVTSLAPNYTWAASTTDVRALQKAAASDRIAATWYSGGTVAIDVNLTDGAPHKVTLYLLDWDSTGRSERVDVRDGTSNALLDSRTVTGFASGRYLTWTIQGHVVLNVVNAGGVNAVVSGVFFDTTGSAAPPIVSLASPSEGAGYTAPASISLSANARDVWGPGGVSRVEFYQGTTLIATSTNGHSDGSLNYTATWSGVAPGSYTLTAKAYDGGSPPTSAVSSAVHITVTSSGGTTATFVATDTTTQGSWRGVYGADGAVIVNNSTTLPSYATLSSTSPSWTWAASTTDVRALQKAAATDRIAATWYSGGTVAIDVNLTDGAPHRVSLYALDFDANGRAERVEVRDATSNALLDSRSVSAFVAGQYLTWTMQGHVVINVINVAGVNAVVSGVFFDAAGSPPPTGPSASFVGTDVTTQGTWQGVYGSDGAVIANDSSTLPAYAVVTPGAQNWTWAASTTDVRALQKKTGGGRIAATWYGYTFPLDVNLTDGGAHRVSIYLVDWDSAGRVERLDVRDATTNALLDSRSVSAFSGGQYFTWTVRGHVIINVVNVSGVNAVVSGLFFGP